MDYKAINNRYVNAHNAASKTRQIVMLYEGAIKFVTSAKHAIEKNNIEKRFQMLERATAIILGLRAALDFKEGAEVAISLDDFYYSIYMRIMTIHQTDDIKLCESVINDLNVMREAWIEIDESNTTSESSVTSDQTKCKDNMQFSA